MEKLQPLISRQFPNDNRTSQNVNSQETDPILAQEAIQQVAKRQCQYCFRRFSIQSSFSSLFSGRPSSSQMKKQATIMGMPVTVEVLDSGVTNEDIQEVFAYLHYIDKKFSTYRKDSELPN